MGIVCNGDLKQFFLDKLDGAVIKELTGYVRELFDDYEDDFNNSMKTEEIKNLYLNWRLKEGRIAVDDEKKTIKSI